MKRILLFILAVLILTGAVIPVYAAAKSMSLSKNIFAVGEDITVSYNGATSKDWIGIYNKGATPGGSTPSIVWKYAEPAPSGMLSLKNELAEGVYEIIFLENDGYTVLDRKTVYIGDTAPFIITSKNTYEIGEEITVDYANVSDKDWIGIYNKGATPGNSTPSIVWKYAEPVPSGAIELDNNLSEGEYDVILLENDGYNILDRKTIEVASPEIPMTITKNSYPQGEKIVADYAGSTGDGWIGIYARGIEPKDEEGYRSLKWKYTKDVAQPDGKMEFDNDLSVGDYDIILFKDGGYTILLRIPFSVTKKEYTTPPDPVSIEYDMTGTVQGSAEGKVTVTGPSNQSGLTGYALYWGDEHGVLGGYSGIPVGKKSGNINEFTMVSGTFIPEGATKLIAYSVNGDKLSENCVSADLPENAAIALGTPLYSFQVISDLHITTNESHIHNIHLDMALKDIKEMNPDSKGIIVVGDMADNGNQNQYDHMKNIIQANKENLPPMYFSIGNHEYQNNISFNAVVDLYTENTGMNSLYFDFKFEDNYVIVLGGERSGLDAYIGEEQFAWLEAKLKEASENSGGPIFVALHQPLKNTVSGSLPGQEWDGVVQDERLRKLLDQYPEVIMFSGHTHWELISKSPMYDGKENGATFFNTASVGYLWTDSQEHKDGSQGLYVEVYEDKLIVKGRDFETSEWVAGAQFMVDLSGKTDYSEPSETEPVSTPAPTSDVNNPLTRGTGLLSIILLLSVSVLSAGLGGFLYFRNKKRVK